MRMYIMYTHTNEVYKMKVSAVVRAANDWMTTIKRKVWEGI